MEAIKYNEGLKKELEEVFRHYVKPREFLLYVSKYSRDVLTEPDKEQIVAETKNCGDTMGADFLLTRLIKYKGWFECMLAVLQDENVKMGHAAKDMETLKGKYDVLKSKAYEACNEKQSSIPNAVGTIEQDTEISPQLTSSAKERPSLDVYPLDCNICDKHFTGQASAQDHFKSDTHIQKHNIQSVYQTLEEHEHGRKVKKDDGDVCFVCDVCLKICGENINSFENHKKSDGHKQKLERNGASLVSSENIRKVSSDNTLSLINKISNYSVKFQDKTFDFSRPTITSSTNSDDKRSSIFKSGDMYCNPSRYVSGHDQTPQDPAVSGSDKHRDFEETTDDPLYCYVCDKESTGPVSAKAHKESKDCIKRHKIKNEYETLEQLENGRKIIFEKGEVLYACDVCYSLCGDNKASFESHMKSDGHKKKKDSRLKRNAQGCDSSNTSSENNVANLGKSQLIAAENETGSSKDQTLQDPVVSEKNISLAFNNTTYDPLYCEVCDKQCSGPANTKAHKESKDCIKRHKIKNEYKTLEQLENGRQIVVENGEVVYACDVCYSLCGNNMASFENHMKSDGHKKKRDSRSKRNPQGCNSSNTSSEKIVANNGTPMVAKDSPAVSSSTNETNLIVKALQLQDITDVIPNQLTKNTQNNITINVHLNVDRRRTTNVENVGVLGTGSSNVNIVGGVAGSTVPNDNESDEDDR